MAELADESVVEASRAEAGAVAGGVDRWDWPQAQALQEVGAYFHQRGWSVGTSSNYSVVIGRDPLRLLITASGKDKGRLGGRDFVVVDENGKNVHPTDPKPSAETLLHTVAARRPEIGAVLHTHSIWGTILSNLYHADGGFWIDGYEMLKGLSGVQTHEHRQWVDVFENTQDIPSLARIVDRRMSDQANPLRHGFLIRRHGLYTWGRDLEEARRHIEIYEFLFEAVGRQLSLAARA